MNNTVIFLSLYQYTITIKIVSHLPFMPALKKKEGGGGLTNY